MPIASGTPQSPFFVAIALHRMNTAAGLRFLEGVLTIFRDAGFDRETAARLFRVFGYYISGASLDEAAGYARGPSAVNPVPDDVAARDYPLITGVNPYLQPRHHRATFELGIDILLAELPGLLPEMPAPADVEPVRTTRLRGWS